MGWKLCTRSSQLHFWRVGINVLQTFSNYEEWRGSLHVAKKPPITYWWMGGSLYYEHLLKLANCLQVKNIDVFLTTIFKASLQPYLRLTITCMARDTFIKHKEAIVICEENGSVIANYNALITHLEFGNWLHNL